MHSAERSKTHDNANVRAGIGANMSDSDRSAEYIASDDDLPDFDHAPTVQQQRDQQVQRDAALRLHYPQLYGAKKPREYNAIVNTRKALETDTNAKHYIKWPKKQQMWDVLRGLKITMDSDGAIRVSFPGTQWEQQFCADLYCRFEKWQHRIKWVTQKQYDALMYIGQKYIRIPNGPKTIPGR